MAFVCTDRAPPYFPTHVDGAVVILVGFDDETDSTYSALCGFAPVAGGGTEEFYFVLIETTPLGEEHRYWSSADVCRFTSAEDRKRLLDAFIAGTCELIAISRPTSVFMCAHDSDLPDKAISKYLSIGKVFNAHGYAVSEQPLILGKRSWMMELT